GFAPVSRPNLGGSIGQFAGRCRLPEALCRVRGAGRMGLSDLPERFAGVRSALVPPLRYPDALRPLPVCRDPRALGVDPRRRTLYGLATLGHHRPQVRRRAGSRRALGRTAWHDARRSWTGECDRGRPAPSAARTGARVQPVAPCRAVRGTEARPPRPAATPPHEGDGAPSWARCGWPAGQRRRRVRGRRGRRARAPGRPRCVGRRRDDHGRHVGSVRDGAGRNRRWPSRRGRPRLGLV
ncbi:MAG: Competence protein F homolog, phosphoribosyltransferase domain; protein YhgH required for utilization of DNA as sole source of carbon and energy, partial [uncultured Thermomicrobiales bacterium]